MTRVQQNVTITAKMEQKSAFLLLVTLASNGWCATKTAFLIIDVQNCFVPGGTLAVKNGNSVVQPINDILKNVTFDLVVRSQDWHCKNHVSFASQHKNVSLYSA